MQRANEHPTKAEDRSWYLNYSVFIYVEIAIVKGNTKNIKHLNGSAQRMIPRRVKRGLPSMGRDFSSCVHSEKNEWTTPLVAVNLSFLYTGWFWTRRFKLFLNTRWSLEDSRWGHRKVVQVRSHWHFVQGPDEIVAQSPPLSVWYLRSLMFFTRVTETETLFLERQVWMSQPWCLSPALKRILSAQFYFHI